MIDEQACLPSSTEIFSMIRISYIRDKNPLTFTDWIGKSETCPFMANFLISIKHRLSWIQSSSKDVDLLLDEVGKVLRDEYNAKIDSSTRELEFDNLEDLTFFILKWS